MKDQVNNIDKEKNQWWKPIESSLDGLLLKSLSVKCPRCRESGLAITRWIKGPSLKPVYILHVKRKKIRKICSLSQDQSGDVRSNVKLYKSDIKRLLISKKSFVLFSGGKDSLAALAYLKGIANGDKIDLTAIYVDTTAGLPENTEYIKKVCRYLKVKLKIVKPRVDYFTLVKKWGIPSFKYRWCCRELKIKPIEEYLDTVEESKVVFDGIRAAESRLRKEYIPIWYHPSFKCLSVSPIFYWSDHDVISYINSNGIPKTLLHSLGSSTECWCGAYKTETDFRNLYDLNKEMFRKLANVEKENKNRYTFLYKNGQKIPLRILEKKILSKKRTEAN
jgi:3'-phosphoadenosine 5'-phosphosulfate sulfotransferase (PAPS reductase)/FAD synthetase